jgi:beta-phosphoglucomutase-like phosphatase (HAD superfamily)
MSGARLGIRRERVLFLDDNIANVEAGRDAGFWAVQVAGVDHARRALVNAGVMGLRLVALPPPPSSPRESVRLPLGRRGAPEAT